MTVLTIIGGGNSGHVCASLVHGNTGGRVTVQLLTSRPQIWSTKPRVVFPDKTVQEGLISVVSSDPAEVIPNADIVLWTGPVNETKSVFESIARFVDVQKTAVGTIFAQGLTHLLAHRIFGAEVKFFALRNIPWLCRVVHAGSECQIVGPKTEIEVALLNISCGWVSDELYPLFTVQHTQQPKITVMPDFAPIVFNPANQIIHPAVYFVHFRKWIKGSLLAPQDEPNEWLYRDMTELAGNILEELDEELNRVKDQYYDKVDAAQSGEATSHPSSSSFVLRLKDRLLHQYGDQIADKSTMAKMVGTNAAYGMAKTPLIRTPAGVAPNPKHRVVLDDIGWGLCVLLNVAERLHVATPMIRFMIEWHQEMMEKEYIVRGRLEGRDLGELVLLGKEDPIELVGRVTMVGLTD